MARTTKKRAKQLKHDKFRDTTFSLYDRLSHRVEGRERTVIYALAGVVAVVALLLVFLLVARPTGRGRERRARQGD